MRIINKSLNRYVLIIGVELELLAFLVMICLGVFFADSTLKGGIIAGTLWILGLFFLRLLAKKDPMFFKVYQRHNQYQQFYLAKTSRWRKNYGYKAK